mmetsp:Transcript_12923/g.25246  ORF Transcript_12923/g.25246 Transcript_12923/m.25246 type:complete len:203 (+) Transcript_12923:117-725(+)
MTDEGAMPRNTQGKKENTGNMDQSVYGIKLAEQPAKRGHKKHPNLDASCLMTQSTPCPQTWSVPCIRATKTPRKPRAPSQPHCAQNRQLEYRFATGSLYVDGVCRSDLKRGARQRLRALTASEIISATAKCPLALAICFGVLPLTLTSGRAPPTSSSRTQSRCPSCAAMNIADDPSLVGVLQLAEALASTRRQLAFPFCAAM